MRKLLAALLAVPVLVMVYAAVVVRRSTIARAGVVVALCAALGLVTVGVAAPTDSAARPPASAPSLTTATFTGLVRTDQAPRGSVAIDFSGSMDAASVGSALAVDPPVPVALAWSTDRTRLLVRPATTWDPGILYTITVGTGARDDAGSPLAAPVRASFLTRGPTTGSIAAPGSRGSSVVPMASFLLSFDRPVDVASVRAGLRISPGVDGNVTAESGELASETVSFVPSSPLAPGTTYRIGLGPGVTDVDGGPVEVAPLTVRVPAAPTVVRFRPVAKTTAVPVDAAVSVRFTRPMDRASTASAFTVAVGGKPVAGKTTWAEGGTVLVFVPAKPFGKASAVVATVAVTARSTDGVPLAAAARSTFTTERPTPKPGPAPAAKPVTRPAPTKAASKPTVKPIPKPAPSVAGNWHAVEFYYLSLMNCTRTGGWVTSSGACSSPGGRDVAPLKLDAGISDHVSRPYARLMLAAGVCSHFVDGNPGNRLRRAGFDSFRWGENIGCQSGDPFRSVLNTHLFYQSEKSYNGGHYVNLMNPAYDRVGIGVWVSGGALRLVIDFYHP